MEGIPNQGVGNTRPVQSAETETSPSALDLVHPNKLDGQSSAPKSLVAMARRGMLITTSSRLLVQLFQLAGTVILARRLGPDAFGLVALVVVFTGFAAIFSDLGLGEAIIQKPVLKPSDLATAFWLNALSGVALTAAFTGLAWPISWLYGRPQLVSLTIVSSLSFTLSISVVPLSMLQRQFRFGAIAKIEVASAALALVVAVLLTSAGFGAMSLAISAVAGVVFTTIFSGIVFKWLPRQWLSRRSASELWSFTGPLIGFNIVNYWGRNVDNLTIGKVSGAVALAFYSRAYNVMLIPINQIQRITSRVLYPLMSSLHGDLERMGIAYVRLIRLTVAFSAPATFGLAAVSYPLVLTLYGQHWEPTAEILGVLALGALPQILGSSVSVVLQALGMTAVQFRRGLISVASGVVAVAAGAHWGALGIAIALTLRGYIVFPLNYVPTAKRLRINSGRVLRAILPAALSAASMAALVFGFDLLIRRRLSPILSLVLELALGTIVYVLLLSASDRSTVREIRQLLRGRSSRRSAYAAAHRTKP